MSILDVGEPVFSLALSSTLGRCPSSRNQSGATFPSDLRLATGTLMDSGDPKQGNHFDVWGVPGPEYEDAQRVGLLARANINFPATKVGFAPVALKSSFARGEDMLATTTDVLTLWDFRETDPSSSGYLGRSPGSPQYALHQKSTMGQGEFPAPHTSFSWSPVDSSRLLTSSTNTTVTLFDLNTSSASTQLIAHDKAVYDVQWCPGPAAGRDQFASCGADGSVRMFDIRALEHSTILYETPPTSSGSTPNGSSKDVAPLLRLAFDPNNLHCLAVLHSDCNSILMIDNRKPGIPVVELKAHQRAINGLAWSGSNGDEATINDADNQGALVSVGDDGMVLVWDGKAAYKTGAAQQPSADSGGPQASKTSNGNPLPPRYTSPMLAHEANQEVNSVAWGGCAALGTAEWVAFSTGNTVQLLQV